MASQFIPTFPARFRAMTQLRRLLHLLCFVPAPLLMAALLRGELDPDPAKALVLESGEMALRLLLLCLTVSPLRRLVGVSGLIQLRRPLGLWAAAWALGHLLLFAFLYLGLDFGRLGEELVERPYISVGFAAFLVFVPLVATSTRAAQRRMGRSWQRLHGWVYLAAVLAVLHLVWQIRDEWGEAFFYCFWLLLLFGERLFRRARRTEPAEQAN